MGPEDTGLGRSRRMRATQAPLAPSPGSRHLCAASANRPMRRNALALLLIPFAQSSAQTTIRFTPDTNWNTLDHRHPVARRIKPGDVVITKTLDASGYDDRDVSRAASGNPMVGPFFVEGAEPGDALDVHFR